MPALAVRRRAGKSSTLLGHYMEEDGSRHQRRLPQSVDQVGALRYTTKLSEYLAASLPIVTGEIPLAYEFGTRWLWRMPGDAPWEEPYLAALADLMRTIGRDEVERRRALMPAGVRAFELEAQIEQVTAFVCDLCRSPHPVPFSPQGAG